MAQLIPLFDPQTSGGLMLALKPQDAQSLEQLAQENGQVLYAIGRLEQRGEKRIMVR
jgi:selenophosphate synthase